MATPLFWETCHMVNTVYNKLLGYPVPLQIDPETQSFRLLNQHSKLAVFYSYLFALALMALFLLDVAVEGFLIGCLKVPLIICVINLLALLLSTVALIVMYGVVFGKADAFWNQYLNCVVHLDRKRFRTHKLNLEPKSFSVHTFVSGLRKGKLKYNRKNKRGCEIMKKIVCIYVFCRSSHACRWWEV